MTRARSNRSTRPPFDLVVAQCGAEVHRVCSIAAGSMNAEAVWVATFLTTMKAYPHLPPDTDIEAWLTATARAIASVVPAATKVTAQPKASATSGNETHTSLDPHREMWCTTPPDRLTERLRPPSSQ